MRKGKRESKYIRTKNIEVQDNFNKKSNVFFFVISFVSAIIYMCYTFFVIYRLSEKNFLSNLIKYLFLIYIAVFILLILFNLNNFRKMKNGMKNYKSAIKFLKYFVQIINFVLSVSTAINIFFVSGKIDFWLVLYSVISFIITVIMIFIEIIKIKFRKNIGLIKRNFLEMREK